MYAVSWDIWPNIAQKGMKIRLSHQKNEGRVRDRDRERARDRVGAGVRVRERKRAKVEGRAGSKVKARVWEGLRVRDGDEVEEWVRAKEGARELLELLLGRCCRRHH